MIRETNLDSIRALEKQIEEGKGDVTKLKRDRNSLLNISTRVPPEILGDIFVWSLRDGCSSGPCDFDLLRKGSYNFLLVCHHWFEVASLTPELWSFWGNTLQDWKKCHRRPRVTPLDLVLERDESDSDVLFDGSLRDAVRNRVIQGAIRRVHLTSGDGPTLTAIVSSLTPDGNGSQNENIESIIWQNGGPTSVDVSKFFARSRLSKLSLLGLSGKFRISSWDHLASQTTLLTALSIKVSWQPSPAPTTSQLFLILSSNPNLRRLALSDVAIPKDTDGSTIQVQLPNLEILDLAGEFRDIFGLLRRLVLPGVLHEVSLTGSKSTILDVSQTLVPYMRDYFRRDTRFQNKLEISPSFSTNFVRISVDVICTQTTAPVQKPPRATFSATLATPPPPDVLKQLFIDFVVPLPHEHVVSLKDVRGKQLPEELFFMMPNIEMLHVYTMGLSEGFLRPNRDGPHANTKLLPSLRSLTLTNVNLNDDNLNHLTRYLTHQTSDNQTISLEVTGYSRIPRQKLMKRVKNVVEDFTLHLEPVMRRACHDRLDPLV